MNIKKFSTYIRFKTGHLFVYCGVTNFVIGGSKWLKPSISKHCDLIILYLFYDNVYSLPSAYYILNKIFYFPIIGYLSLSKRVLHKYNSLHLSLIIHFL